MGWGERPLLPEEQAEAVRLLSEALEQGAYGLSSGSTCPPGSYAQPSELLPLCQALRPFGGLYVPHLHPGRGGPLDSLQEALDLARDASMPLHVAGLSSPHPGGARTLLDLLDRARADGQDVTFDAQPYPYSSTPLVALLPAWAQVGGPHAVHSRLRDRKERLRVAQDPSWLGLDFRSLLVTNLSRKRHQPYDGWPLESIAQAKGESVVNTLCDLLLEEQLAPSCVVLGGNPVNIRAFCQHPAHMVASGGAPVGAKCNPRSYGAFPFVLGNLCREEALLSLPDAVRRMTSLPARRLRLSDRGLLLEGMRADVVVFDPGRVASPADLSAPRRSPHGVEWVIVNGVPVVTPSGSTAATPGRGLRRC
jgi:N-acyl-D-amino-acid deacylase